MMLWDLIVLGPLLRVMNTDREEAEFKTSHWSELLICPAIRTQSARPSRIN